jgi:fatty-acyl-CoA synthase
VGRPDRYAGELPILFVQLRPGMEVAPEELLAFVEARIQERAALPKAVHILDALPLSGPGKVSKVPLRHEAARAVMQADVDALDAGSGVVVSLVEDDRHGVVVRLSGRDGACSAAAQALAAYPYRIVEEHPA